MSAASVAVTAAFDDLDARHLRFLQEAARAGSVLVLLWTDEEIAAATGARPKFPFAERRYLLESLRFVDRVAAGASARDLPRADAVFVDVGAPAAERAAAQEVGARWSVPVREIRDADLAGFPGFPLPAPDPSRRRVVVTGCYDWLHSGHVRFFEEVAQHGELYVVVGHDANVRLLKGDGHPRFPEEQRRWMTSTVRHVHRSLISSGTGWMDAEPEIRAVGAHVYAVNEDGDKPEKREFCRSHGLEYLVLRREPAEGLPRRSSTDLRGF